MLKKKDGGGHPAWSEDAELEAFRSIPHIQSHGDCPRLGAHPSGKRSCRWDLLLPMQLCAPLTNTSGQFSRRSAKNNPRFSPSLLRLASESWICQWCSKAACRPSEFEGDLGTRLFKQQHSLAHATSTSKTQWHSVECPSSIGRQCRRWSI